MASWLSIIQLIFASSLIIAILLQSRGTGLGSIFGGTEESYRSKRGAEKLLFYATIGLAVGFLLTSVLSVFSQ